MTPARRTVTWRRRTSVAALLALGGLAAAALPGTASSAAPTPGPSASGTVTFAGGSWGDKDADKQAKGLGLVNDPDKDPGSLYTLSKAVGARKLWKHEDPQGRPLTGRGVTVALLDTGVTAVPGLDAPGKLVQGPDLSGAETPSGTDELGHGTFMAGLIAARDAARDKEGRPVSPDDAAGTVQQGLAPDATLLSVKLAGADGEASVQAVVAALDWVVAHKDDQGRAVRVVNLSFGARALQGYEVDPLAAAAERAWAAGIVVVASVGNDGAEDGAVSDPALDPYVLAVGASSPKAGGGGAELGWQDAGLAGFSSRTTGGARHADLVAPGSSVVSLAAPGSRLDAEHPEGRVSGDTSGRLFRGSGTSEATAVVSGAAALLLQADPTLTPDQVKAALVGTARPVKDDTAGVDAGAGQIDLEKALKLVEARRDGKDKGVLQGASQSWPRSAGLDDAQTAPVDGTWDGARWMGARWMGARWMGARWMGARWMGSAWS